MTNETIFKLRSAAETFVNALNDAALAMEPKDDTPVPPIPERYAGEFAHEEPPRYATPKCGERFLWQSFDGELLPIVGKSFHNWTEDGDSKRWILRKLDKPPMPKAPEGYEHAKPEGEYREWREGDAWMFTTGDTCHRRKPYFLEPGRESESRTMVWILRKLPTFPSMPAPANECWWCEAKRRWITVYGKRLAEQEPPEGWEFTGKFVPPKTGVPAMNKYFAMDSGFNADDRYPRLILRPAPKRKRLVFEQIPVNEQPINPDHFLEWFGNDYRLVEEL